MRKRLMMIPVLMMAGCSATGTWSATVDPGEAAYCEIPDADQIKVVYPSTHVPNYLTVSINNDQFVFDECAPSGAQNSQGDFMVDRGGATIVRIGLSADSTLRDAYFPPASGTAPMRSDMTVKMMGRDSCYETPYTIVPTTPLAIGWQPMTADNGACRVDGWDGTAQIN